MQNPTVLRIKATDEGAVRVLTFARPDKLNAFDSAMWYGLASALDNASTDDSVHVVVLTGEGRAFSAGQDIDEMTLLAAGQAPEGAEGAFPALLDALGRFDKPLLAAVNGFGIGIGATILGHCDLVVMAQSARLKTPFAPMGVAPEAASSYLLPLRLGPALAADMLLRGRWITAEEALSAGLALEVVPDDEVLARTVELAREVAAAPLASLRAIVGTMRAAHHDAIVAARAREDAAFEALLATFVPPI